MKRLLILIILVPAIASIAMTPQKSAETLAKEILTKGAALFDTKDASAIAETYTADAHLVVISKDQDADKFKVEVKEGRNDIAAFYRDLFKNGNASTSRNTVEFARLVSPDLLVIHGVFEPDVAANGEKYSFVQERVKEGDRWRIMNLRLYLTPKE